MSAPARRWNHNLHYHPVILGAVPEGCRRGLDVGCGLGMLARDLRRVVPHVTGIDRDAASIDVAAAPASNRSCRPSVWSRSATGCACGLSAPRLWPPLDTFEQTRRLARRVLPGVRYRRLVLWRYSLVWTKPA